MPWQNTNVGFPEIFAALPTVSSWPFSEVRERLLNMMVVERVRFAL
jgi:hypothetical protein